MRAVNHLPFGVVPDNRRAAQPFENAHLNFLWAERDEPVEPGGKTFQRFARQPGNQVSVDVNASLASEKTKIILQPFIILPAFDGRADRLVERLDPDLELQRARRELRDDFAQRLGQSVGNHFEMEEMAGPVMLQKEFENGFAD